MATYQYIATDLVSGQVKGNWLPLIPQNFTRNINSTGTFTGALNLTAGTAAEVSNNIAALEPEKSVLWVFQDGVPVWVGIVWDWPHQSVLDNTLPISASTVESLFSRRLITDDLEFSQADIFDIFRSLATYALGKTPNGQVAGWTMGTNQAGVTANLSYVSTDYKSVYDAWTDLITAYGFEYSIRPAVNESGGLYLSLDLGYPTLGQPLTAFSPAYQLPGNLLDYRFTRTGSTSANTVYATSSVSGLLSALNATPTFAAGKGRWAGANGATVTTTTAWSDPGNTTALQFTGNGTTANPTAVTEVIPVTAGQSYTWSADLFSPQGWTAVNLNILWKPSGPFVPIGTSINVAAGTASTGNSMSATAPDGATGAIAEITMAGTPASSVQMMADNAIFSLASPSSQSWASELPHGQDPVVLGAGYPLLEAAVNLSTVNVTAQAQIDAYADGQLALLTGTQLTPLLTLGADQQPAVKDITLGSWCWFNASSPLHPAGPNGEWGLQITGRITGWSLYPPSDSQSEYTAIQLGALEEVGGTIYIPQGAAGVITS